MKPPPSDALQSLLGRHWHHLPASEVGQLLETNLETGLDVFEVKHRRERFGPNRLTPTQGRNLWIRFLLQFHNPLIYILLAAGGVKLAMGGRRCGGQDRHADTEPDDRASGRDRRPRL